MIFSLVSMTRLSSSTSCFLLFIIISTPTCSRLFSTSSPEDTADFHDSWHQTNCSAVCSPLDQCLGHLAYSQLQKEKSDTSPWTSFPLHLLLLAWYVIQGARIAYWLECQACDWKVVILNPSTSSGKMFFFRVNFMRWLLVLFCVPSIPVLQPWRVKDPGRSAKSAGGRLHLNKHTPLTQWNQSGLTMPLSRYSVGTYQETSSHRTCQQTLG